MRNILGPKILKHRGGRAAQHATARWVIRIFFIHGLYLHIGMQGQAGSARKLAGEISDLIERNRK